MQLFHGSLHGGISEFKKLSHFGTRDSALAAAAAKYFDPNNRLFKQPAWMYEFDYELDESMILDVDDFGAPHAQALLSEMTSNPDVTIANLCQSICSQLNVMRNQGVSKPEVQALAFVRLEGILRKLGVNFVRYSNSVESSGDASVCIIDCSSLEFEQPKLMTFDDLRRGYELLSDSRKAHVISPENW